MRRWALVLLVACGQCEGTGPDPEPSEEMPSDSVELPTPDLRVVMLTDLKGYLEPCGCTSNPLGGIDRMRRRLRELEDEAPTVFLATGDLFFGSESHAGPSGAETDLWRAETLVRILNEAGLDAATPGDQDLSHGPDTFAQLHALAEFPLVAKGWTVGEQALASTQVLSAGELRVGVIGSSLGVVTTDPNADAVDADVAIVLAHATRRDARTLSQATVDFVVMGGVDRDDAAPPSERNDSWILQGSRQGQGLLVLDLYRPNAAGAWQNLSQWTLDTQREAADAEIDELNTQLERWREEGTHDDADLQRQSRRLEVLRDERRAMSAPAFPESGRVFAARWEPLEHSLEGDPATREILERLDVRINDHNQTAFADRTPPPVPEGDAHYLGSQACASCHAAAFEWWQGHAHGRAYATLEERNKQFHLTCVGCHVTGYERPGGSTVTHLLDGALQNVGCENCHGPGSAHVAAPATDNIQRDAPERLCTACHNEEHSDLFQYDAYRATLLVPGHGRPE